MSIYTCHGMLITTGLHAYVLCKQLTCLAETKFRLSESAVRQWHVNILHWEAFKCSHHSYLEVTACVM